MAGLQTTLDGKAELSHTHDAMTELTNVQKEAHHWLFRKAADDTEPTFREITFNSNLREVKMDASSLFHAADFSDMIAKRRNDVKYSWVILDEHVDEASFNYAAPVLTVTFVQALSAIPTDSLIPVAMVENPVREGHVHAISDVTGLQTTMDGKASVSHMHAIGDVTNLQTTLDSHNHSITSLSDTAPYQTAPHVQGQVLVINSAVKGWENRFLNVHELGDVTIAAPSANQVISYSGSGWVNSSLPVPPTLPIVHEWALAWEPNQSTLSTDDQAGLPWVFHSRFQSIDDFCKYRKRRGRRLFHPPIWPVQIRVFNPFEIGPESNIG